MGNNGLRRENRGVFMQLLGLLILSHLVIITFRPIVALKHRETNFRPVELIRPHSIPLAEFVASCIVVIAVKEGTCSLIMIILVICCDSVLLLVLLLELIRFLFFLFQILHQRILLLALALIEIIFMFLSPARNLRYLLILSQVCYIFNLVMYSLFDPGSTLSYVTPYMVVHFGFSLEYSFDPFSVSTSMCDSVLARKVYRDCVLSIYG